MRYYGFTMIVKGIPEEYKGIQMIEQRMLFYIDPNQTDNDIKHQLLYGTYSDFAFSKPFNLNDILTKCKEYKIIPIVNLCITEGSWKQHKRLTPSEVAKIGKVLNDILKERGFTIDNAYIGLFNEPNTQQGLTSAEVCEYTNALDDAVDFKVVYGNDEFGNLDWNYLAKNCRAKVMGIHHLSSLGSWEEPKKNFKNIKNCKTIADTYGKEIIGSELGSWFKDYCSKEGHQINLDIMAECKKYGYLGCLIVLPQINEKSKKVWKLLGYEVYPDDFIEKIEEKSCSTKFNEVIKFIKLNGTIPIFEEEDMKLKAVYKNGMKKEIGIKFIQMILNEDMKPNPLLKVDGWWGDKTDTIVLAFQEKYNLAQYGGAIGPNTMQFMIKKYPNIWDNFQYQYSIGAL